MNAIKETNLALPSRNWVALTPQEIVPAQQDVAWWCQEKIVELGRELAEARQNLREVKRLMLGSPKAWQGVVRRTVARMLYYTKIRAALRAGFLIIPNLDTEIIAVRVNRAAPITRTAAYPTSINRTEQGAALLPPGVGRYVDETLPHEDLSFTTPPTSNAPKGELVRRNRVNSYTETVDFPIALVKPVILAATEKAMGLKIFDRIGVAHGHGTHSRQQIKADPIVVGQIIDGGQKYAGDKVVTFFLAWWLDSRSL